MRTFLLEQKSNQFTRMLMSAMRYWFNWKSHHQFRFDLFISRMIFRRCSHCFVYSLLLSPLNRTSSFDKRDKLKLFTFFTDVIFTTSCHHLRAPEYYIATVQNRCSWKAYPCSSYLWFWSGLCNRCYGECPSMGYSADKTKHTGSYFLDTTSKKPFCGEHSRETFAIFKKTSL